VVSLLVVVGLSLYITYYGRQDHAEAADVIVILGAGTRTNGAVSAPYARRIKHAVALYQRGLAPKVICTGGFSNRWHVKAEAQACQEYLIQLNVPASAILMETASTSTEENAIEAQKVMATHGLRTAILVTDDFHILRAEMYFRLSGITVYPSAAQLTQGNLRTSTAFSNTMREVAAFAWHVAKSLGGLRQTATPF
jgi:uncharacterized SAM-binding protein YcdF (DUF218 family)